MTGPRYNIRCWRCDRNIPAHDKDAKKALFPVGPRHGQKFMWVHNECPVSRKERQESPRGYLGQRQIERYPKENIQDRKLLNDELDWITRRMIQDQTMFKPEQFRKEIDQALERLALARSEAGEHLFVESADNDGKVFHSAHCKCPQKRNTTSKPQLPKPAYLEYFLLYVPADGSIAEAEIYLSTKKGKEIYHNQSNLKIVNSEEK